jgi:hypothetical protein
MPFAPTSPITGGTQTGLTSPTYTHVADVAPDVNGKQIAVTALGGTQTGVTAHSIGSPFTMTAIRPKTMRLLPQPNPTTGVVKNVPKNTSKVITRKGVIPLAGQAPAIMIITTTIDVPAGADTADTLSVRAALSAHVGLLNQQSAGIGELVTTGIL